MLGTTDAALWETYDLAMLDLDGVVYIGKEAVPGAPTHLGRARERGLRVAFITNNASRPPREVSEHLVELGVEASPDDVVTSAQAAARVLWERLGEGAPVVLLGAGGLHDALVEVGLEPVGVHDEAKALVTGYGPDVLWRHIMKASVRIRDGLWWVASNTDMTIPTAYGTAPGHGVLVETISRFAGVSPVVAGKPARPLLEETMRRCGGERPLMVGDRLDTDILGGYHAGVDSLLVLTGVTDLAELVAAPPQQRPTYIAPDLAGLGEVHRAPEVDGATVRAGGWSATVVDGRLEVTGQGEVADWWRVAAVTGWRHLDEAGEPVALDGVVSPA